VIDAAQTHKIDLRRRHACSIQLGGPGMRIGMGGGAASSMATGTNAAELDFDSVQRGNPEIQRRAQEVINHCWALGEDNPILAIHDVGAGGLSQRLSRTGQRRRAAVRASTCARCRSKRPAWRPRRSGATRARSATCWPIAPGRRCRCSTRCAERERCPFAVVGVATDERQLRARTTPHGDARAGRHADGRAARQAAQDAPRRAARARGVRRRWI
jgi:phosphoribosylformylglycinamidine synthase